MRLAAAARSYSSLSQASRASSPPGSQLTASPSTSASSSPVRPSRSAAVVRAATIAAASSSSSSAPNLHRTASAPTPAPLHTRPRLPHAVPHLPAVEHPSLYTPLTNFPEFTPRVFKAGTYTVQLVLDHREQGKNDREAIANGLRGKGVSVVRRALEIGDVAWVARSIYGDEECMLDVVLERKRLDDLVSSITGPTKRFHEQKVCWWIYFSSERADDPLNLVPAAPERYEPRTVSRRGVRHAETEGGMGTADQHRTVVSPPGRRS